MSLSEKKGPHIDDQDGGPLEQKRSVAEGEALELLGYKPELKRNRSMITLLFQSLAIAAIPYGEGGPLISAIYGGGQLSMFLGWIVVMILGECVATSLGELASRYPTSGGPSYWSYQVAPKHKVLAAYITGWVWLIGYVNGRHDLARSFLTTSQQLDDHAFRYISIELIDRMPTNLP